ncbi:MAG: late competence development ComFB family protein [Firmicutes bacterium]|nr:late competence development ComFB family protein [Bacillota bacterium]
MVVNVMEEIARNALQDIFEDGYTGCMCEVCQNDILAIALNRLPPQYSSRQTGEAYIKARLFADQWKVDVLRELTHAADIVSKSTRHA